MFYNKADNFPTIAILTLGFSLELLALMSGTSLAMVGEDTWVNSVYPSIHLLWPDSPWLV